MITAFIEHRGELRALAATLGNLVAAAVEGVVLDAFVLVGREDGEVRELAEAAGADLLVSVGAGDLAGRGRGEWLLFLESGAAFEEGWTEAARAWGGSHSAPARFRRGRLSVLRRLWPPPRPLEAGLLIRRDMFRASARPGADLAAVLPRRRGRIEATLLPARR
ncbi:glycosyl transferase [Propylenella binzhouense]|uniref:Glycosyl transferase n=1 Tax=Propylenella binzhouense TaxID=2555902 RepID=A0A964T574_9HYPH|nr:glycosyl transferase [Propylenella binzhouense]MYZ47697.1 glycosyl transferase [Propylenella binzhouense]